MVALQRWFHLQWAAAPPLDRVLDDYVENHQLVSEFRRNDETKMAALTSAQGDKEGQWRHHAIVLAERYWGSDEGRQDVASREMALQNMRKLLDYPHFNFEQEHWSEFLRIPELGRIRLGHEKKTISQLPKLRSALRAMAKSASAAPLKGLQEVAGIGRNLAPKLMAMHRPDDFVVINEPVESALSGFGYELDIRQGVTEAAYRRSLKDLEPFTEACKAAQLPPAAALDAFFYRFRGRDGGD